MKTLKDTLKSLSKARRDRIEHAARERIAALHLQQAREQAGISQEELAKRLDMSQPALSRVEHRADVRLSTLVRYVEAMGGEIEITARVPTRRTKGAPPKKLLLYGAAK